MQPEARQDALSQARRIAGTKLRHAIFLAVSASWKDKAKPSEEMQQHRPMAREWDVDNLQTMEDHADAVVATKEINEMRVAVTQANSVPTDDEIRKAVGYMKKWRRHRIISKSASVLIMMWLDAEANRCKKYFEDREEQKHMGSLGHDRKFNAADTFLPQIIPDDDEVCNYNNQIHEISNKDIEKLYAKSKKGTKKTNQKVNAFDTFVITRTHSRASTLNKMISTCDQF